MQFTQIGRFVVGVASLLVVTSAAAQTPPPIPVSFPASRLEWTPPEGVIAGDVVPGKYQFNVYIDTVLRPNVTTCASTVVVPPALSVVTCGADKLFALLAVGAHSVRVSTSYLGMEGIQSMPLAFTHSDRAVPGPPSNLRFGTIALKGMLDGVPFEVAFVPSGTLTLDE